MTQLQLSMTTAAVTEQPANQPQTAAQESEPAWRPDGEFRHVDPRYVPAERFSSWITTGVVGVLVAALLVSLLIALWPPGWGMAVITLCVLAFMGMLVWLTIRHPQWVYDHLRYAVTEKGIEIHRGIFWRRIINVPRSRIQHTDVSQGPVARRHGIATLQVYTAGTQHFEVDLPGLSHDVALQIRDFLVGRVQRDG